MAVAAPRPCAAIGCSALVRTGRYCERHAYLAETDQRGTQRRYNEKREASDKFYDTAAWRKLRVAYLKQHPLCVECERAGRVVAAVIVDHIVPVKANWARRLDVSNLRGLCREHHNRVGERVGLRGGGGRISGANAPPNDRPLGFL